jgi:mannose-6-phosphate isomerase-like protein (cupin superfamily)
MSREPVVGAAAGQNGSRGVQSAPWILSFMAQEKASTMTPARRRSLSRPRASTPGGSFFLSESTLAAGFAGPPPHRHRELHDMFYVLEGTLTLHLGEREIEAGPGTFPCVPPGVGHTFRNDSDRPVRLLNFNMPAGWENYMRDLAEAAESGLLTPEVIARVASRHDFELT